MEQNFITVEAANAVLRSLVTEQAGIFAAQQATIEGLNAETRSMVMQATAKTEELINKIREDVDQSLKANKASAEAHATEQVGSLRTQTEESVTHVDGKIDEMRDMLLRHDSARAEADQRSEELLKNLRQFADEVKDSIQKTQTEVNHTQRAITQLIETTRVDGTSSVLRSGFGGERDRAVFDPRDYKIDFLPASFALGVWKKWRHEVEIYIDTIGPSWRGVKLLLQQARHSGVPLEPNRESMTMIIDRATKANKGQAPVDYLFDFATKAATLYRMLVPKLNLDLSTEFRNSAPDNGFELWRLLNRKLDPPRADLGFHLTNDLRKHARTSCADFAQTVRFISMLEQKRREFQVETGEPLDPVVLGEILGAAIDEDTMSRIEDANKIEIRDYEAVKLYVEQRHTKLTSRAAGKAIPKDTDKMVYGVGEAQPEAASAPAECGGGCGGCAIHPAPTSAATEAPAAPVYDPWTASPDPWSCQPCGPEAQEGQWHLDPFGKGKKGGGKDRLL